MASVSHDAARLCRALVTAATRRSAAAKWSPVLENTLHNHGCRKILTPKLASQIIFPGLLHHHHLALGFFHWTSQQPGFSQTPQTFDSLLKVLFHSNQHSSILKLIRSKPKPLQNPQFHFSSTSISTILRAHLACAKTREAFATVMATASCQIDSRVCNSILAALCSEGRVDLGEELVERMRVSNIGFSDLGLGVFVGKVCSRIGIADRGIEKVLSILNGIKNGEIAGVTGSIVAFLVIDGLCRASRIREAWRILEELRSRDCKPDFLSYSVVIESLRRFGHCPEEELKIVLRQKRKLSVAPRLYEYREFVFLLIGEGRAREAMEIAEAILRGNFPIDDDVYDAVITSIAATDPDSALLFCKSMVAKQRFPGAVALQSLGMFLINSAKSEETLSLLELLLASTGYFSTAEKYNAMIALLCKAGEVKRAYGVLQEMRKNGHSPEVASYNSVIEACCAADMLRPARKLWDEMFATGCEGNLHTYNILIEKFAGAGEVSVALRLFDHMLTKEERVVVVPDKVTYNSLIKGCCREMKFGEAIKIFELARRSPNGMLSSSLLLLLLNTLVMCLCKAGNFDEALMVLRGEVALCDMNIKSPVPDVIVLKCLAEEGELGKAMEHCEWLKRSSPSPPQRLKGVVRELTCYLSVAVNAEPVVQLLQEVSKKGLLISGFSGRTLFPLHLEELSQYSV